MRLVSGASESADSLELLSQPPAKEGFTGLRCGDIIDGVRWYVFRHRPYGHDRPISFLVNSHREIFHQIEGDLDSALFTNGLIVNGLRLPQIQGWAPASILGWLQDDRELGVPDLIAFHSQVKGIIRKQVVVPNPASLELLTLFVVASFYFPLFAATPFLHIGASGFGSGKSHLASVLLKLCFNGSASDGVTALYGKITPAALCRVVDCTGGVVGLDDMETITNTSPSPLRQLLLTSFLQSTGNESMMEFGTGKSRFYRLFGPKIFTSIGLPDAILGSRCLAISLQKAPPAWKPEPVSDDEFDKAARLGYQLAMSPVLIRALQDDASQIIGGGRAGQISQGLRSIAKLIGGHSPELLEVGLAMALQTKRDSMTPMETLVEAVKSIVKQGYLSFSMGHLQAELRLLGTDIPAAFVSRMGAGILFESTGRILVHGYKTADLIPTKKALSFAKVGNRSGYRRARSFCPQSDRKSFNTAACSQCRYNGVCEIQKKGGRRE